MILRRELPGDRSAITAVHDGAFSPGEPAPTVESRLVDQLRADGDTVPELSLVALAGDGVVGHVVCSRGWVGDRPFLGLGPLGVLPPHQRSGVGNALMHGVLAAADARDEPAVFLLGDPGYYQRFGFVLAEPLGLLPPVPAWREHFQLRPLTAWDGSTRGTFRYASAFDRL
jgi:putative acetyltransferase